MNSRSASRKKQKLCFTIPAVIMLLVGFGSLVLATFGSRLHSDQGTLIPTGFATASLGAALLTRSLIAVFSLVLFAVIGLIFCIRDLGVFHPLTFVFAALLPYSLFLTRKADS